MKRFDETRLLRAALRLAAEDAFKCAYPLRSRMGLVGAEDRRRWCDERAAGWIAAARAAK